MERPLIGLTTYGRNAKDRYELQAAYSWCVFRAGGAPVLLPPVGGGELAQAWLDRIDALVLTGGGDVNPAMYGGNAHPTMYTLDAERDTSESSLAREALQRDMPILAICRGLQVFNVVMGGTLYPHLPDVFGNQVAHRLPPREPTLHSVRVTPGSKLATALRATEMEGVSWHHQAIRDMAPGLVATAYAPDGVIEGAEAPDRRWFVGVQWHPEMSADRDPVQQNLFDAVVEAVRDAPKTTNPATRRAPRLTSAVCRGRATWQVR